MINAELTKILEPYKQTIDGVTTYVFGEDFPEVLDGIVVVAQKDMKKAMYDRLWSVLTADTTAPLKSAQMMIKELRYIKIELEAEEKGGVVKA
jgi:hypothetical protein